MRQLFQSERRCVASLFQAKWKSELLSFPAVVTETVAEPTNPRVRHRFNCDFILDFVDWQSASCERAASAWSILPNALGAELFLIVDKATLRPTALELNGGGAFPMAHFAKYLDGVEVAVREALRHCDEGKPISREVLQCTSVRRAAFARILVVGNEITFLYFPNETMPAMRGKCVSLASAEDRLVECYYDLGQIVCFDGWVKTEIIATDQVLVAVPE